MAEQEKRMVNLDLMKAYGILMVISLHVSLWNPDFMSEFTVSRMLQYAMRIIAEGVPFFVTINGFLLLRKNEINLQKHLKKCAKLFLILLLWSFILGTVGLALDKNIDTFSMRDLVYVILNTQVGASYTGVLWFLQNLLGVYLIFPVLWYIYQNQFHIYRWLFWVVSFFVLGVRTMELLRDGLSAFMDIALLSETINYVNRFSSIENGWYVFYFMLGGMMYHYLDKIKAYRKWLTIIGAVSWPMAFLVGFLISKAYGVTYNQSFNYGSVFMVAFILGMFAGTLPCENKGWIKRVLASIGRNTFGMYLSHVLFIFVLNYFWDYYFQYRPAVAFVIVVVGSYLFSIIVRKIPYVKKIIEI